MYFIFLNINFNGTQVGEFRISQILYFTNSKLAICQLNIDKQFDNLLTLFTYVNVKANSVDPDQTAATGAV